MTVGLLLVAYLALSTGWDNLQKSGLQADSVESQARAIQAQVDQANAPGEKKSKETLQRLEKAIPHDVDFPGLLSELSSLAISCDVVWNAVSPNSAGNSLNLKDMNAFAFGGTLVGNPSNVQRWLDSVTRMTRLVTIDSVGFKNNDDGTQTVTIQARTYTSQKSSPSPATPPISLPGTSSTNVPSPVPSSGTS